MPALQVIGGVSARTTTFAEAREQLDEWEKSEPTARRLIMILDADETVLTVTGLDVRPSDVAGLCMAAASIALE